MKETEDKKRQWKTVRAYLTIKLKAIHSENQEHEWEANSCCRWEMGRTTKPAAQRVSISWWRRAITPRPELTLQLWLGFLHTRAVSVNHFKPWHIISKSCWGQLLALWKKITQPGGPSPFWPIGITVTPSLLHRHCKIASTRPFAIAFWNVVFKFIWKLSEWIEQMFRYLP